MNESPVDTTIDTLIIVCCHAIYLGQDRIASISTQRQAQVSNERNWLIEPFQRGEIPTFIDHARTGIQQLSANPSAILCFSGGATKPLQTRKTEAEGYRDVAEELDWFGLSSEDLRKRVFLEEWAADSYQNVLLGLIQFALWVEEYARRKLHDSGEGDEQRIPVQLRLPRKLVVVSHAFKASRFTELHLPAIRALWKRVLGSESAWDLEDFEVIGANPPFDTVRMKEIEEGDRMRGYGVWKDDLYGNGEVLSGKRKTRGWDETVFLERMESLFEDDDVKRIKQLVRGVQT